MNRMQKSMAAVLLATLSLSVLFFFNQYGCGLQDLENIDSFDPSGYDFTYNLQTFRLKTHDRSWTLFSESEYNALGELQWKRIYYLDSEGQSYYMNGDERQYVSCLPRRGLSSITNYLSEFQLSEERFDENDRVVFREGVHPSISEHHERAEWYYSPSTETDEPSTLSVFVRSISSVSTDGIEPVCYNVNDEPLLEYNTYEITNFDRYGNETRIWADGACFLKTDATGYLEAIIEEESKTYRVIRVDDSGKPLWSAVYLKENQCLISYTIYQYKLL